MLRAGMSEVKAFGTWDAPVTDGAERIEVPLDRVCMSCERAFLAGDNGAVMPSGYAQHRECVLRSALGGIGHHVDHARYCRGELGSDAGLSPRQSALLVWRHLIEGVPVTEAELTAMREAT